MERQTDRISIWNVHEGIPVYTQAQEIFNILGRVRDIDDVSALHYQLDDGQVTPVFFKHREKRANRLEREGEFNIDTIRSELIKSQNRLKIIAQLRSGEELVKSISFPRRPTEDRRKHFRLNLDNVRYPEEIGQIVDGHWTLNRKTNGHASLEITKSHAGLDRIILLTDHNLSPSYRVRARLRIRAWTGSPYNLGIVYHWNPHLQGDGYQLPSQWTTGLAYYYSHCKGLRIRTGIDVHIDERGVKVGDHILDEHPYSYLRYRASQMLRMARVISKPLPQLRPDTQYWFDLLVGNETQALTVWNARKSKPKPQIIIRNSPTMLSSGAAGIIAHRCAVQIEDFEVQAY